jgi:hypothetical protein
VEATDGNGFLGGRGGGDRVGPHFSHRLFVDAAPATDVTPHLSRE